MQLPCRPLEPAKAFQHAASPHRDDGVKFTTFPTAYENRTNTGLFPSVLLIYPTMWPFKKKRKIPYADDLSPRELEWLQTQRSALDTLAQAAHVATDTGPLRTADAVIQHWHSLPQPQRSDPNTVVNAAGVALGDALAKKHGLQWKIITDAFGTDMGVWCGGDNEQNVVLSPTHSIAKRFADSPDGCVVQLFDSLSASTQSILGKPSSG